MRAPAARLGLTRIAVGGYTMWYLLKQRRKFHKIAANDAELFAPVGATRLLSRPLPSPVAAKLVDATLVSTALFTVGAGHRVVGPVHAALLSWTLSYRNSWSMVFHSENTLLWHTLILGAARATDATSVDALITRRAPGGEHPRYDWPLRAMRGASSATYLLSGVAKVAGPAGWQWASGSQMRRQVAMDQIRKERYGSHRGERVAQLLYPQRRLFTAFAASALVLELGAPLAMLDPRLGRVWAAATYGMHWGIRAIMGIRFRYQLSGAAFAPWLELERLFTRIRPR